MSDGSKEQIIRIIIDDAAAVRQSTAFHQGERKRIRDTGDVAAKAAKDTAKSDADAKRQQEKAAKESIRRQKEARQQIDADHKAAADRIAAREKSAASAEAKAAIDSVKRRKEARQQIDADHKAAADRIKVRDKSVSDAAVASRKKEMAALRDQHKLTMMNWELNRKSMDETGGVLDGLVGRVKAYVGAYVGFQSVAMIAKSLNDYFAAIKRETNEAARDMIRFRDALKQIATLTGHPGQTTPALIQNLEVRQKSFQTGEEANEMMTQMWASAAGSIDAGLISKEEMTKSAGMAGQLSKMQGANPGAVGKLWGSLPQMTGKKVNTANDINVLAERLNEEQLLGGWTNIDQYSTQMNKTAPYVTKGVYSAPVQTALLSTLARGGQGDTAGDLLESFTSGVGTGMIRNRGMKIDPKFASEYQTSSKYIATLKDRQGNAIGEHTQPEEIALAIAKDLDKALNFDDKDRKYVNIDLELQKRGFANEQTRKAIEKFAGEERVGGMLTRLVDLANSPLSSDTSKTEKAFGAYIATDPTGMQAQQDLAEETAKAKRAMDPSVRLMQMDAASFFQLKGKGEITGELKEWQDADWFKRTADDLWRVEREGADGKMHGVGWYSQVKQRTQDQLGKQLKDMGINFEVDEQLLGRGGRQVQFGEANYLLSDEQRAKAISLIQAQGGNPMSSVAAGTGEVVDLLKQQLEELRVIRDGMNRGGAAVVVGGAPLVMPPPVPGAAPRGGP